MDLFFDLLRSVIYGVIEGITEWLPIMHAEKNKVEA